MVDLTVFRLHDGTEDFDDFVDLEDRPNTLQFGPITRDNFAAKLYVTEPHPRLPSWVPFIQTGFPTDAPWRQSTSVSALLVLKVVIGVGARNFALAFSPSGRFLLRENAYRRRFGLITALNIITESDLPPRLRALDTARHGASILRSRLQTTGPSGVETFELDVLRDLVRHATGEPGNSRAWGGRVGGSDALRLARDIPFDDLGSLCHDIDDVSRKETYKERFEWIDFVTPVVEEELVSKLEEATVKIITSKEPIVDMLQLAPPEVVEWDRLVRFQYHTESQQHVTRPDLSFKHYRGTLTPSRLDGLNAAALQRWLIKGFDASGEQIAKWTVWRCLVGELELDGSTFVLENGAFYRVDKDYLANLHAEIKRFEKSASFLPAAKPGQKEKAYNKSVEGDKSQYLCLDAELVPLTGARNGIELCDVLSSTHQLIHVKRYTSSETLSHLYNQARTSAELLQTNGEFRENAQKHVADRDPDSKFTFVDPSPLDTATCEVVLAVIKQWGDSGIEALPFFAKLNLRRVLTDISSWGFKAAVVPVPIES